MYRHRAVVPVLIYLICLVAASLAYAQTPPPKETFNAWFWNSMDFYSFGSAALAGLMGGALRTIATLRSRDPTFKVFLETLGDALTALVSGFVVFLLLLLWQNIFSKTVDHNITFVLAFVAGFVRGGIVSWLDDTVKKSLNVGSDAIVGWLLSKSKSISAQQQSEEEPK